MPEIKLKSGESFWCSEGSILDAGLFAKFGLPYSCKRGDCESCECVLTKGKVKIRDEVKSAGDVIKTCAAEPIEDCVLDVELIEQLKGLEPKSSPAKVSFKELRGDIAVVKLRFPPSFRIKFLEGQYLNLIYQSTKRAYSIASTSDDAMIELHIKRVDGGVMSSYFFRDIREGSLVHVELPLGSFFVRDSGRDKIFLATGTGFAPVKAMVEKLISSGSTSPIWIYWGNRQKSDIYTSVAEQWASEYPNITYVPLLSQQPDLPGRKGYVQDALLQDIKVFDNVDVYACGSPEMINLAKMALNSAGLPSERFYSDAFVATT